MLSINQTMNLISSFPLQPQVRGFFDPGTWTVTYVVFEKAGSACAIIDSVLDYDPSRAAPALPRQTV